MYIEWTSLISALIGILPAIGLLYLTLFRFEGYFNEKRVFGTLIGGMGMGFLVAVVESIGQQLYYYVPAESTTNFLQLDLLMALTIMVFGFSLLEQLAKLTILNLRRFQDQHDTGFYGASTGLGFGAIYVVFSLRAWDASTFGSVWMMTLYALLLSLGVLLFHSATGTWLGYGVSQKKKWGYYAYAVLTQIPFNGVILVGYFYPSTPFLVPACLFAYGLVVWIYVYISVLPKCMPRDLVDKNRRERRRELRKIRLNPTQYENVGGAKEEDNEKKEGSA